MGLVGDAAGYVTKCSGEGIYFAAKSGRMCAEAIVEESKNGTVMVRGCSMLVSSRCSRPGVLSAASACVYSPASYLMQHYTVSAFHSSLCAA